MSEGVKASEEIPDQRGSAVESARQDLRRATTAYSEYISLPLCCQLSISCPLQHSAGTDLKK